MKATKTRAAKLTTIFATTLMISLGLCGANFFATLRYVPLSGPGNHVPPTAEEETANWVGSILGVTAFLEVTAIFISIVGLIWAWLAATPAKTHEDR